MRAARGLLHPVWSAVLQKGRGRSVAGWHMRGVFIAEPSVAGFGRQLLNTAVEQVLKKAPAFPAEKHPAAKERVPALPGWRGCCRMQGGRHLREFSRKLGCAVIWRTI